jgi:flagellar basal-body rod modification protein FlgD
MTTIQNNVASPELLSSMNPGKTAANQTKETQDRFMTLLVTQMKNQDPLNPLDNAAVTSQLAQLSTVTGIDKLNTTLEALMTSFQSNQSLQAAGMIGRGVLTPGSSLQLAEGKALFGVEMTEPADKVTVTIRDAAGKAVRTMDVGAQDVGIKTLGWDGQTDAGSAAADGDYRFEVTATRGSQSAGSNALEFGMVGSVTTGATGVQLNISGVGSVALADVRQIL